MRVSVLVLMLAFTTSLPTLGGGPTDGSNFVIPSVTANSQVGGYLDHDGDGNFVVVWGSGSGYSLPRGRRFDSSGQPAAPQFDLNAEPVSGMCCMAQATNGNGEFVVAWEAYGKVGTQLEIFVRRFDAMDVGLGDEFIAHVATSGLQQDPALAIADDGSFVVTFASFDNPDNSRDVYFRRFDSNGDPVGLEMQVNEMTSGAQRLPEIAMDADGDFVIVWSSTADQDGSGSGIFARRYDDTGNPLGGEFQINSYTTGDQVVPDIAMSAEGEFVVVWASDDQDGSDRGIFGQRFDASGNPAGGEFQVNTYTTGFQFVGRVDAEPAGGFVVAWSSLDQDGSQDGVFGQRFHAAGERIGDEFQVNTYTPGRQSIGGVSFDNVGDFVITWTDWSGLDGDVAGVFGQRYAPEDIIFTDGFESGDTSGWSAIVP